MLAENFIHSLRLAFSQWRVAGLLAGANVTETRRLNRIALLTPFLSVLFQAGILGLVYSELLGIDLWSHLPYLAVSLALWQAFANFLAAASLHNDTINRHMSFTRLSPYTFHLAGLFETGLLLGAKLLAACIVVVIAGGNTAPIHGVALAALGLAAIGAFLFFFGILAAHLLDRHRVIKAVMPQLLFLAFLLTPVLWQKEQLTGARWLAEWNPLHHVLEAVRVPLLTGAMPWHSLTIVVTLTLVTAAACRLTHRRNRDLITFRWVA